MSVRIKVIEATIYNLHMEREELMDELVKVRWGMTMTKYSDEDGYFEDHYDPDCEGCAFEAGLEDMITQLDWEISQKEELLS